MKVLLTGAAGFIGSCFLQQLNSIGIDDVLIVDTEKDPAVYANLQKKKFHDYLTREELLKRLDQGQLQDVDTIVHLGACADTTQMDRIFLANNNVEYSKRLVKWALASQTYFHYASSASVYGDGYNGYDDNDALLRQFTPLNPYAESKWLFDKWLIDEKLTHRVVGYRYFNVFGPNEYHKGDMQSMVAKAFHQIQDTGKAKLFATTRAGYADGSEERDFIYVKDINKIMTYFLEHPDKCGIFNLGTGKARTFKDLVTAVFTALGEKPNIHYIPMPDKLKGQYQYFTEAKMTKLQQAGYTQKCQTLEASVSDYVTTHLKSENPIL